MLEPGGKQRKASHYEIWLRESILSLKFEGVFLAVEVNSICDWY